VELHKKTAKKPKILILSAFRHATCWSIGHERFVVIFFNLMIAIEQKNQGDGEGRATLLHHVVSHDQRDLQNRLLNPESNSPSVVKDTSFGQFDLQKCPHACGYGV
jgi:hypothetical protein